MALLLWVLEAQLLCLPVFLTETIVVLLSHQYQLFHQRAVAAELLETGALMTMLGMAAPVAGLMEVLTAQVLEMMEVTRLQKVMMAVIITVEPVTEERGVAVLVRMAKTLPVLAVAMEVRESGQQYLVLHLPSAAAVVAVVWQET